jgi:hypothetical protein
MSIVSDTKNPDMVSKEEELAILKDAKKSLDEGLTQADENLAGIY